MFSNNTLLIMNDKALFGCGLNGYYNLGLGHKSNVLNLKELSIRNIIQIESYGAGLMFLSENGEVYGTGANSVGQLGLGYVTEDPISTIIKIPISNVKQIACGTSHTFFLMKDGTVKYCGYDINGRLGIGNTGVAQQVIKIHPISNVKQISCSASHTYFLMNDGTVKACGQCPYGFGLTGAENILYTPAIIPVTNVDKIICGGAIGKGFVFFMIKDGNVKACGFNGFGQLGVDTSINTRTIVTVPINNVKDIACGEAHTIFLMKDNSIKSCGLNNYSQTCILDGAAINNITSTGINGVKQIYCGQFHTLLLFKDARLRGYGSNVYGQMSTGISTTKEFDIEFNINNISGLTENYFYWHFLYNKLDANILYKTDKTNLEGIKSITDIESLNFIDYDLSLNNLCEEFILDNKTIKPINSLPKFKVYCKKNN